MRACRSARLWAGLLLALAVSGAIAAGSAAGRASGGGGGQLTTGGQAGQLQLDRSARADVVAVVGRPAAEGTGSMGVRHDPSYDALGYGCRRRAAAGRAAVGAHGPYCQTVYYVNARDHRLSAVYTSSATFAGPGGLRPGVLAKPVERRTHHHESGGFFGPVQITFGGRGTSATLVAEVRGASAFQDGGRIEDIALESRGHPVGLLVGSPTNCPPDSNVAIGGYCPGF